MPTEMVNIILTWVAVFFEYIHFSFLPLLFFSRLSPHSLPPSLQTSLFQPATHQQFFSPNSLPLTHQHLRTRPLPCTLLPGTIFLVSLSFFLSFFLSSFSFSSPSSLSLSLSISPCLSFYLSAVQFCSCLVDICRFKLDHFFFGGEVGFFFCCFFLQFFFSFLFLFFFFFLERLYFSFFRCRKTSYVFHMEPTCGKRRASQYGPRTCVTYGHIYIYIYIYIYWWESRN